MTFPATAKLPMPPVRTAISVLMLMFAAGLGGGDFAARGHYSGPILVVGLAIGYLCFLWYCGDSDARGLARSRLLGTAMVALPLATVPYYLLRSRQAPERGNALGAFAGLLLLMPVACLAGIGMHLAIRHAGM